MNMMALRPCLPGILADHESRSNGLLSGVALPRFLVCGIPLEGGVSVGFGGDEGLLFFDG